MTCPEPLVLSQLVDGELAPVEASSVGAHLETCAACRDRLSRLEWASSVLRAAMVSLSSPAAEGTVGGSGECLAPELVAGWVQRALPSTDLRRVEAHLERCDGCLGEAMGAAHLMARLDVGTSAPVPAALAERVASRLGATPVGESLTRLVIRIARAGATLVERHIVAPILDLEVVPVPATAVRAGETGEVVSFHLRAAEAQIRGTIVPQGAGVRLVLLLLGGTDEALSGQRVFLRRHGRSIYSVRTDAAGRLETPRIEPGVYEVACPAIGTSFRLDLRS